MGDALGPAPFGQTGLVPLEGVEVEGTDPVGVQAQGRFGLQGHEGTVAGQGEFRLRPIEHLQQPHILAAVAQVGEAAQDGGGFFNRTRETCAGVLPMDPITQ